MTPTGFEINPTTFPAARFNNLASILNIILPLLMIGAGVLALLMGLLGGIKWITSGSNPESLKKAQQTITMAAGGLLFVLLSYVFMKLIGLIFKIPVPL
jgi:hypothetical protein